jgi:hypothetical protein
MKSYGRDLQNDECGQRADWFWNRRPRLYRVASYILWLALILGLPFWLFIVPSIGLSLFIVWVAIANTEIVQFVRWRRQYELSIDRLIHASTRQKYLRRGWSIEGTRRGYRSWELGVSCLLAHQTLLTPSS